MTRIARLTGLFSILLLFFIAALAMSQRLLHRQTERLRAEAVAQKQAQLSATLDIASVGAPPWAEATVNQLERALDAQILLQPSSAPASLSAERWWEFTYSVGAGADARDVMVRFARPPAVRLLDTYQRIAAILLNLALGVIVVFAGFLLWSVRARDTVDDTRTIDRDNARAGFRSLQHLAKVSARQGAELERERAERLRIEEDLNVKQLLLNRALEQKIRLGQDLHDGIIQSLYATGLTLEASQPLVTRDPAAATEHIRRATTSLNGTIRDVRAYINGLSPAALRRQTFAEAVDVLGRDLAAGREVTFDVNVDATVAAHLPEDLVSDLLQVVRESVSNSLRHGQARRIAIALRPVDDHLELSVSDDGHGFDTVREKHAGHGLANITARVQRHGGVVALVSQPGHGTRITCTLLPVPAES